MQLQDKKYKVFLALILCSAWCMTQKGYAGLLDYFKCCKRRPVEDQAKISKKSQGVTLGQDENQRVSTPRRSKRLEEKSTQSPQKQVDSPTSPTKSRASKKSELIDIQKSSGPRDQVWHSHNE